MKILIHYFFNRRPILYPLLSIFMIFAIAFPVGAAHIEGLQQHLAEKELRAAIQEKQAGKHPVNTIEISASDLFEREIKSLSVPEQDIPGTPEEELQGQLLVALGNETPLFAAVSYFNETRSSEPGTESESHAHKVIKLLATSGADLNAVDDHGFTVLLQCTVADNTDLVKLLLELGADAGRKDNQGKTARDIAYDLGHRYLYQILY